MKISELQTAKTLVVGMGRSGLAALELLRRKGVTATATDLQPLEAMPPDTAARLDALGVPFAVQRDAVFEGVDLIVLSPGVPADLPPLRAAAARGAKVIGEVELAGLFLKGGTIGITGSNGKTTTTALTGHILRESGIPAQVGGNIGNPPANMVASSRAGQWNVLELSSFQLETTDKFRVAIAAILNLTPDHLDRHYTLESYAAAKRRILETQTAGGRAVLNADDGICREFGEITREPAVWFSSRRRLDTGLWIEGGHIRYDGQRLIDLRDIPLRGIHNAENVMAAAAAAHLAGADLEAVAAAVRTFPGVEHRLEHVCSVNGVDYFNDSKATNVDAALKAIGAFQGGLWIILGGKDKGSDYTPLQGPLKEKARAALLIGTAAAKISNHLGGAVEEIRCGTMERAVEEASRRARPGDTVLLAPACASFDQFDSYEHRGQVFKSLAAKLGADSEQARKGEANCV